MKKLFILLLTLSVQVAFSAPKGDMMIARNSHAERVIVVAPNADSVTRLAATELAGYLGRITGATFSIATASKAPSIVVKQDRAMKAEAFNIGTVGRNIVIAGSGRGVLFGVYALLEKLGARLYAAGELYLPNEPTLAYRAIYAERWEPTIEHRDTHYKATNDQLYVDWHRLSHDAKGALPSWGLFVHTFDRLCPAEQYLQSHPEYYSLRDGRRVPSQLCLSNPEVLEIVCTNLAAEIAKNPAAKYWSVSSNDNHNYCQCDKCQAANDIDGSPTGSVIQFVNKVADRFPDKVISTLAYQYSRAAPKVTRPRENVNIMFCSIECNRSLPIEQDSTSASFVRDMRDWAAISDNIFLWDYIIQFRNLVSPFPNFSTLEPNIRFFVANNVKMLFEQGNREVGGEFSALRSYVVTKLMNYPDSTARAFMEEFCDGYYGSAGQYVLEYIDALDNALAASGERLSIFGDPRAPVRSWLSPTQMDVYQSIFANAENAVKDNAQLLRRVRIARQPLYYAELEQARAEPYGERGIYEVDSEGRPVSARAEYIEKLQMFIARCEDEGVTRLAEWHTTPVEYLEMMLRTATVRSDALSYNRSVTIRGVTTIDREAMLTDGIQGSAYGTEWVEFSSPTYDVVVDLGAVKPIKNASARFFELVDHWSYQPLPTTVTFYGSSDGVNFSKIGSETYQMQGKESSQMRRYEACAIIPISARYVKASVEAPATAPQWHIGAGRAATTLMDELIVE